MEDVPIYIIFAAKYHHHKAKDKWPAQCPLVLVHCHFHGHVRGTFFRTHGRTPKWPEVDAKMLMHVVAMVSNFRSLWIGGKDSTTRHDSRGQRLRQWKSPKFNKTFRHCFQQNFEILKSEMRFAKWKLNSARSCSKCFLCDAFSGANAAGRSSYHWQRCRYAHLIKSHILQKSGHIVMQEIMDKSHERKCLFSDDCLGDNAAKGEHGQTSILQLFEAHILLLLRLLGKELFAQEKVASIAIHRFFPSIEGQVQRIELKSADGTKEREHISSFHHPVMSL